MKNWSKGAWCKRPRTNLEGHIGPLFLKLALLIPITIFWQKLSSLLQVRGKYLSQISKARFPLLFPASLYFSDHENAGIKVVKSPNRSHRPFSPFGSARNKRYEISRAKIDMHMLRGDFLLSLCNRIPHDFPESQNAYATNTT